LCEYRGNCLGGVKFSWRSAEDIFRQGSECMAMLYIYVRKVPGQVREWLKNALFLHAHMCEYASLVHMCVGSGNKEKME
jgi:hypothetical protein